MQSSQMQSPLHDTQLVQDSIKTEVLAVPQSMQTVAAANAAS